MLTLCTFSSFYIVILKGKIVMHCEVGGASSTPYQCENVVVASAVHILGHTAGFVGLSDSCYFQIALALRISFTSDSNIKSTM